LFKENEYPVLAVSFKTENMLIALLYPNKPWDWQYISENPNLTMEIIEKYPNKPWDWYLISYNSNITMDFIEKNQDKINFHNLSNNRFNYIHK
jgi:hypothetical protein